MDPSKVFCHNPDCPARGKVDCGNIAPSPDASTGNVLGGSSPQLLCIPWKSASSVVSARQQPVPAYAEMRSHNPLQEQVEGLYREAVSQS
jgi:hypothetical protein